MTPEMKKELDRLMVCLKNEVYGEVYHVLMGYVSLLDITDDYIVVRKDNTDDNCLDGDYRISVNDLVYSPTERLLIQPSKYVKNIDVFDYKDGDILISKNSKDVVIFETFCEPYENEYEDDPYYMFLGKKLINGDDMVCKTNEYRRITDIRELGSLMKETYIKEEDNK